jgi:hypothetical protein
MSMDLALSHGAEVLLGIALLSALAALVYCMLRSARPDPKMALWLALLKGFPKD